MSNPPSGVPGDQGTPWPKYGQDGANAAMPAQGAHPGGGYGGPTVMPTMKLPSRAPGTIMIVVGLLMMLIVAPIIFGVLMFQGVSGATENMANGTVVRNYGTVEVGSNGSYTVSVAPGTATGCMLVKDGNKAWDMERLEGSSQIYYRNGLMEGTYTIECEGLDSDATITGLPMSAEDLTSSTTTAFIWSSVVGVSGTIIMIVGIVLLVKVNGNRRRITQEAMLSTVR